jgi:hypothetical protein
MVTCTTANVPTPELQKLWSTLLESLRLEHEDTVQQQRPDADAVMERVGGVLTANARLEGCTHVPGNTPLGPWTQ